MTRNRATARQAGARFERHMADWLAAVLDNPDIDRRVTTGAKDKGDIGAVRHFGQRVVVECKDAGGQVKVGPWLNEAEVERGNDDALAGVVVAKRRGTTDPGDQIVLMTARDFVALLTGELP